MGLASTKLSNHPPRSPYQIGVGTGALPRLLTLCLLMEFLLMQFMIHLFLLVSMQSMETSKRIRA